MSEVAQQPLEDGRDLLTAPEETRAAVADLVERYRRNADHYRTAAYNETQTRREFLDPFFEALGWDVSNREGLAEPYKDVIHEDALRTRAGVEAPDYCFRIGGRRVFFVEAKKPSVHVRDAPAPAYQLRRYGFSAGLALSVLTDFEELALYDCRLKPKHSDGPSVARVDFLTYEEYLDRLDEVYSILSKEAILKGYLDRYAEDTRRQRGTTRVDDEFLKEIEAWREALAREIALRNPPLSVHELNFAVQALVDRILFLRIAEDRGAEPYARLRDVARSEGVYPRLCQVFRDADDRYNAGLFDFGEHGDRLSLQLEVQDKALRPILAGLYYPDCPYEFSVITADILGAVYERFLGKVIRLTPGHRAKVEEKPEVRKAGGVYYTPRYIVDYIVEHTVGEALREAGTPEAVAGLRILDPACGSGSFLLGAYQYLLDWHLRYYLDDGAKKHARGRTPALVQVGGGDWRLTPHERKRILLNNIYGVDLDPQAVEVTKLNLLLKCMEGQTAVVAGESVLLRERLLPNIDENIKCGNSLIGPDYFEGRNMGLVDEEELRRVRPFDWDSEFPAIMAAGGFDVVIGNPPYIRIQNLREFSPESPPYFKAHYRAASKGNYDIYVVFVERGLGLLSKRGRLGFILPHKFMNAAYGEGLRALLSEGSHVERLVHFGDQQVFERATTYTCLLFLSRSPTAACRVVAVADLAEWRAGRQLDEDQVDVARYGGKGWTLGSRAGAALLSRLMGARVRLGDVAHIFVGTQTSADQVFVLRDCIERGALVEGHSKALGGRVVVETPATVPFLHGREVRRYAPLSSTSRLVCPYEIGARTARLLTEAEMRARCPMAWAYLRETKTVLASREGGRFAGSDWYGFGRPQNMAALRGPKIVVPFYNNVASYAFDAVGFFFKTGYGLRAKTERQDEPYLLGLLNSALLFYCLKSAAPVLRGGYVEFRSKFTGQLPIRTIDFSDRADAGRHDRMVELVQAMLDLHERLPEASTPRDRELLQRQIDATDRRIDQLVYELYGLTDEEIRIVEEATS